MSLSPGNKKAGQRRLAEMSAPPRQETYRPPDKSAGDTHEWTVMLDTNDWLIVWQHVYRGKVVDFAIMQMHQARGGRSEIARIDCCQSVVHRHVFDRAGVDMLDHQPIQVIPAQGGSDTVNTLFGECYERMMEEFDANLRRWRQT